MEMLSQLQQFWPIIIMIVIFYFLLWRPQKKQQRRRQEMMNSLKVGTKIMTAGGIYGTITGIQKDVLELRIADQVIISVSRNAISQVFGTDDAVQ
ncbi:preprotein translocase subunit YajC [Megasphaera sp. UPII 135-E]|uniref:preprotein translocase subunit YajC n=1 Tax=Megasphaera sp. UPII 135-E TaxID=1000569 RepID=UPI00021A1B78|nr:preprotein translocase subunit YajC [Megasphaera sp. UPII 135-E]EGS34109.1 preprotein translocase, YajC subunit [Megasphaera sp. UPII 135-E]